jgi:hypothetical protein
MSNIIPLQDLIALDPPSAGTKSPDNPLTDADLIFARCSDGSPDRLILGRDWLNLIIEAGVPAHLSKIVVLLEDRELEVLLAMVEVLRGHHDVESVSEH